MKYSEIFSTSWKIAWKYKILWIFGILSSCMRTSGGGSSSGGGGGSGSSFLSPHGFQPVSLAQDGSWIQFWQLRLEEQPWLMALLVVALIFLALALIVVVLLAGTIGRIGVARGAWLADAGEQKLGFGFLLKESWPYFWRVFLLFLLLGLAGLLIVSLFVIPVMLLTIFTLGIIWVVLIPFLLPMAFVLIGLSLGINALIEEAVVAIVGENLGVFAAIERAWKLLWEKPFPSFLISLASSVLQLVVNLLLVLPAFLLILPLLIAFLFSTQTAISIGAAISGISFLVYIPVVLVASGILYAYIGSLWAVTFRRLTGRDNEMVLIKEAH